MSSTYSLLIVEEDQDLLDALARYFIGAGFAVTSVRHPRQALAAVNWRHYDAAIVDILLPEMDGISLMLGIKNVAELPIVILSSKNDASGRFQALEKGAVGYVVKPCRLAELRHTVEDAISDSTVAASPVSLAAQP